MPWAWVEFSRACVEKWYRAESWGTPGLGAPGERGRHREEVTTRTTWCPEATRRKGSQPKKLTYTKRPVACMCR